MALVSCRKDDNSHIKFLFGEQTDEMLVTVHDTLIDAIPVSGGWDQKSLGLDLDNNNQNDIWFFSKEYLITYPEEGRACMVWFNIINDQFSVAAITGSNVYYETHSTSFDYIGPIPRRTNNLIRSCEYSENAVVDSSYYFTAETFEAGSKFTDEVLWNKNDMYLNISPHHESIYNWDMAGDSIIGQHYIHKGLCHSAPQNETIYLVFKKELGLQTNYGWIELKISDENTFTSVLRQSQKMLNSRINHADNPRNNFSSFCPLFTIPALAF
ncbi:MAG: hypothetical protein IPG07_18925 [Crocinitomicaceae bacterium]|nr:hypothetical protein [Crocinitomicaceae bacterium]